MSAGSDKDLRPLILSAAAPLFMQHGYAALSMREIAASVGVSKAALYYHFRDKEELFLALLDEYLKDLEKLLEEIEAEETSRTSQVRRFVERILNQPLEQRALIRLASQEMAQLGLESRNTFRLGFYQKFIHKLENILTAGIKGGEFSPFDPAVLTWTLLGMLYPYFYSSMVEDMPAVEIIAAQITQIFFEGVKIKGNFPQDV